MSARRSFAAAGAAFAVGIGYTDPGNWATDFNAAEFGTSLLWGVIVSGAAAAVLQSLVVCHVAATRSDLATQILKHWPRIAPFIWPIYAFSIVATETAEFAGVALGLRLVFHLALPIAMALAGIAFLLLLLVRGTATRPLEWFALVTTIVLAAVFIIEWVIVKPPFEPIVRGALIPQIHGGGAFLALIGIVGATIMPHNLFLQGGLVAEDVKDAGESKRRAFETSAVWQTVVALVIATALNMTILVVAHATHATSIERGFSALTSIAGNASAVIFGLALVMAGLAATATGARAGDFVFPPGAPFQIAPLMRRILSIVPAAIMLGFGIAPAALLVGSQIVLGLALPFVVVPLFMLAYGGVLRDSLRGRVLLAVSFVIALATLACDGASIVFH